MNMHIIIIYYVHTLQLWSQYYYTYTNNNNNIIVGP